MTEIEDTLKVNKANNEFIAECLDMWAAMLESDPEMTKTVIKNMDKLSDSLKKSAGVVMFNAD